MSISDIHKKKRRKNFVLLALIFAWCALIWAITMVKMAHAQEQEQPQAILSVACTMDARKCPDGSYVSRDGPDCEFAACPEAASEAPVETLPDEAMNDESDESSIDEVVAEVEDDEELVADEVTGNDPSTENSFEAGDFIEDHGKWQSQRKEHQEFIEAQPAIWWENWQDKIDPEKK